MEKGHNHVSALQAAHKASWGLGRADRFDFDFNAGIIKFTFEGEKIATAPVSLIGTWAGDINEFLWGWDHPMCPPADNKAAQAVKDYADTHNITELQTRAFACDGDDGWQYAGIACLLGELQGVYRAPNGNNLVYLGFGTVTLNSIA